MKGRTTKRFGGLVAVIATVAALAALPSSASASASKCGNVFGPGVGAKVTAKNIKCGNAIRYTNACISKGKLQSGFSARLNKPKGTLKLTKGDKRIILLLSGGYTTAVDNCIH
jgi:hypothetical protein